jgi:hypothetical protein
MYWNLQLFQSVVTWGHDMIWKWCDWNTGSNAAGTLE